MVGTVSHSSPLPTSAGSRKSALPHPLWSKANAERFYVGERLLSVLALKLFVLLNLPVIMSETTVLDSNREPAKY